MSNCMMFLALAIFIMKVYFPTDFNFQCPSQETYVVHHHGISFYREFHILRKILQTCVSMNFPDFQRQMVWWQVFCKCVPENFYIANFGGILPMDSW